MARTLPLTILLAAAGCSQPPAPPPAAPPAKVADAPAPAPAAAPAKAEEPPAEKSKYSLAQYAKLKIGMTEDEVRDILGEPTSKREANKWRFAEAAGAGVHVIYVDFDAGKVVTKGTDGFVAIDATKLTKENVRKVKVGMSETDIVELLGPGNPSETTENTVLAYNHDAKRVLVVFAAGKVTAEPEPVGFD